MYRQLTANTLWHILNLVANIAVGLGLTPYFIHALGPDRYGLWVFAASLSVARGVLGLFDFGIQTAVIKFVAEFIARNRRDQIGALLSLSLLGYVGLGLGMATLIGSAALFGMGLVTGLFRIPPDLVDTARVLLLIVAAQTLFDFPALAVSGVLSGLQRYDITRIWNLIRLLVYTGLSVGLIAAGAGVYALAAATFAGEFVRLVGHIYYLRRLQQGLLQRLAHPLPAQLRHSGAHHYSSPQLKLTGQSWSWTLDFGSPFDPSGHGFVFCWSCSLNPCRHWKRRYSCLRSALLHLCRALKQGRRDCLPFK